MEKILVIGHSHMNALRAVDGIAAHVDFMPFAENGRSYLYRDPAEFEPIARSCTSVVFLLGGTRHITLGMVNPPQPFDFYLPGQTGLPFNGAARLLPVDLVTCLLKRHLKDELDYLGALAAVFATQRRFHVESPPPLPDAYIEQYPAGFADKLRERGVSPFSFRYKFWRLHSQLVQAHCARLGITFLAAPAGTQEEDGCLAQPFRRQDPTHANAAYGKRVIDQLCDLLGHAIP